MTQLAQPLQQLPGKQPRVVIIGGGFGGIHAAKSLAHLPVEVTIIDRRNHHTFQPLLYQVALAVLSPADIASPIRSIVRHQKNTQVLMDEVIGIDTLKQSVALKSGAQIPYDYLVVAAGSTHSYFGHEEWSAAAPGLKTVEDATEIRRRVLLAFELAERHMQEHGWHPPLNFVVIGGGPTGVELAGAIRDIAQYYMKHDFRHINPQKAKVLLLDGGERLLAAYPPDLSAKAQKELEALGVEVHLGCHVTGIEPGWVETGGPRPLGKLEAAVILWAAGVQASPLGKMLGGETDKRGCVIVDDQLNPANLANVFVLGDLAHFVQDGKQVPGVAQPAMQMGDHVAKMISADLKGAKRPAFRYFDKGDMATIGRMSAVADVKWPFKAHMGGFPAWFTWLTVHIFFLIGFRNRIAVLFTWVWSYFSFTRSARLITGDQRLPGWQEQVEAGPARPSAAVSAQTGVSGSRAAD
ncbi:NAD(P)/FAD-dependent oxidoreductase [Occallatibacter riparius]|uniref:NADH:ubiquinone reductase (non-electrogenic) n=1 Tax=Occallatibacter riparius TaxID=1002689 RepID=A0A9J7BGQ4_9BACT|nr:NAD(P)/FAD-dependent oxidoreductase [Occallatibacter riparius]UWZ81968.1 NAD(P)/FAD-dependent oxidoreductase [Occallatibacter riparius]